MLERLVTNLRVAIPTCIYHNVLLIYHNYHYVLIVCFKTEIFSEHLKNVDYFQSNDNSLTSVVTFVSLSSILSTSRRWNGR